MEKYLTIEELESWDFVAIQLEIEDDSLVTYTTPREELKVGLDLLSYADSDNNGWSRWGSMIVEEIGDDVIVTSLGEITPNKNLCKTYSNVYPYHDGFLTAKMINDNLRITVADPKTGKEYTAMVPRSAYYSSNGRVKPMFELVKKYFPEAIGYIEYLEEMLPTPKTRPLTWKIIPDGKGNCHLTAESGLFPAQTTLPSQIKKDGDTYRVISVEGRCSIRGEFLERLDVAEGIEEISTFTNCLKLNEVNLPSTLREVGYEAFSGCRNLAQITIPDSVRQIGFGAFKDTNLTQVTLPENLEKLYFNAFMGTPLQSVHIPPHIDTIWGSCFEDCRCLTEVTLPQGLRVIGERAFKGCENLREIIIPDQVRYVGEEAFADCVALSCICIPKGTIVADNAFEGTHCKLMYRDIAHPLPTWSHIKVLHREQISEDYNLDFNDEKDYATMAADTEHEHVFYGGNGFHEVRVTAFNQHYVRICFNGWNYVLAPGEEMTFTPNNDKTETIKVV